MAVDGRRERLQSGDRSGSRRAAGVTAAPPRDRLPYLLLVPALVFLLGVTMPPFVFGLVASFTRWSLTRPDDGITFVGLHNYASILTDPSFGKILSNTLIYTVGSVAASLLLGLGIALLLNRRMRGKGLYQTLLLIPMVATPMVIALGFRYLYNGDYGVITYLLSLAGGDGSSPLGSPATALLAVMAVEIWQWTPFMALVLLAGLESIPRRPYEAASVDGASAWQTFRFVTLPQLRRVVLVVVLIRSMDAFRSFDLIYMMTKGGPGIETETLIMTDWRQSFAFFNIGIGAALAMIMLYGVLVVSWSFMRAARLKT